MSIESPSALLESSLQFWRIKNRPILKKVCSPRFTPSDYLLKKAFHLDDSVQLTEEKREEYQEKFKKRCRQLMNELYDEKYLEEMGRLTQTALLNTESWMKNLLGEDEEKSEMAAGVFERIHDSGFSLEQLREDMIKTYGKGHFLKLIWKGKDRRFKIFSEVFVNLTLKLYELAKMSWSQWLTTSSEGIRLLTALREGDRLTRRYAGAVLLVYLSTIYIEEAYDQQLFNKEMFAFLPVLSQYLPNIPLLPKAISYMTSKALLKAVKASITAELEIPDEFFENWNKRAD